LVSGPGDSLTGRRVFMKALRGTLPVLRSCRKENKKGATKVGLTLGFVGRQILEPFYHKPGLAYKPLRAPSLQKIFEVACRSQGTAKGREHKREEGANEGMGTKCQRWGGRAGVTCLESYEPVCDNLRGKEWDPQGESEAYRANQQFYRLSGIDHSTGPKDKSAFNHLLGQMEGDRIQQIGLIRVDFNRKPTTAC